MTRQVDEIPNPFERYTGKTIAPSRPAPPPAAQPSPPKRKRSARTRKRKSAR